MTNKEVHKNVVNQLIGLLQEGKSATEAAQACGVTDSLAAVVEHSLAFRLVDQTQMARLDELAKESGSVSQLNMKEKDFAAKELSKWLVQAGMQPGQVHICTGLDVHKCRHLYRQMRRLFETEEALLPLPRTLVARVIMSIFATHYTYLQRASNTNSIQLNNVIVAWQRTCEEINANRINEWDGFDPRMHSLGTLFDVARALREVQTNPGSEFDEQQNRRLRKIIYQQCPKCGCFFVGFNSARVSDMGCCCFCELLEGASPDGKKRLRKKQKLSGKTCDSVVGARQQN